MANIAFYGSHNAAVAVEQNGKVLTVIEIERFLNTKNAGYGQYLISYTRPKLINYILDYIYRTYGIKTYDTCYYQNTDTIEGSKGKVHYEKLIPAKNYVDCLHHYSHAASGFYQTDYNEALIISFDGGGNDGYFNIYHAKDRNNIEIIFKENIDLGFPYMIFGNYLNDIKMEPALNLGNLVYSGKLMGLCSYGKVNKEWVPHFKKFYLSKPDGENYIGLLEVLSKDTGIKFDTNNRLEGQEAYDIAATSQEAFEQVFFQVTKDFIQKFPDIPIILVGGCALNIILNNKVKNKFKREVFIPPNPNDCGLASGMILDHIKPKKAIDLTYSGTEVLDKDMLMYYVENKRGNEIDTKELCKDLNEGSIVGVVRGQSEHGPRALGHRSILCNPGIENMKDILNEKVKKREWYRPFAPVCKLEDVEKYFNFKGESRFMSFCPTVKPKWRKKLSSITHVDNTARIQTVTKEQNEWLYNLLTEFEKVSGYGVLLNTSFNVNGKPILSSYSDAMKVFLDTDMDKLILENYYFRWKHV